MLNQHTIYIFSACYPYIVAGDSFLEIEIAELSTYAHQIILVPYYKEHSDAKPLPSNVRVDNSLIDFFEKNKKSAFWSLFSLGFVSFFIKNWPKRKRLNHKTLLFNIKFYLKYKVFQKWIQAHLSALKTRTEPIILYAYWLDFQATAIAAWAKDSAHIKTIARAHRYDLYDARDRQWPLRKATLTDLDACYSVSKKGSDYLQKEHAMPPSKIQTAYLGSLDAGQVPDAFLDDDTLHILSVSSLAAVKRVDFILDCIMAFSRQNPTIKIHYHHIGGAFFPNKNMQEVQANCPSNLNYTLHGLMPLEDVFSFYKNQKIDIFINLSTSEGLPVSLMEALSFGVPCIAPAIGGIPEIVNKHVGVLLSAQPKKEEVVTALKRLSESASRASKSRAARVFFEENFAAGKNYKAFAGRIRNLK